MYLVYSKENRFLKKILSAVFILAMSMNSLSFVWAEETIIETGNAIAGTDTENNVNSNNLSTDEEAPSLETEESEKLNEPSEETGEETQETETVDPEEVSSALIETEEGEGEGEESPGLEMEQEQSEESEEQNAQDSNTIFEEEDDPLPEALGEENNLEENNSNNEAEINILNENEAIIQNTATTSASTGDNQVVGDNVVISTGNALAYANVVNLVNTNIFNSAGFITFFNQLFGTESLDLRSLFEVFSDKLNPGCSLQICDEKDVNVSITNSNSASINNSLVVRSNTGGNAASGYSDDGSISIMTGDAYAVANILNIANTNVTNSNYLLVSFNNIGDFAGDIVLPGKDFFLNLFRLQNNEEVSEEENGQAGSLEITAENNNEADIQNNISSSAETGGNTASGAESSEISTGDAASLTNVYNQVNTNVFGADSFLILFRINGDWLGKIHGLPDGIFWAETANGIELFNAPSVNPGNENAPENLAGGGGDPSSLEVTNNNQVSIANNVSVFALTGENKIDFSGDASISTGNALATTNVTNIVNTNILGRNWVLLIFNIFGDWDGDVAFGRPDLWLGIDAVSENGDFKKGSRVNYKFTVSNLGDADATNVMLKNTFDGAFINFPEFDNLSEVQGEKNAFWNLGTIASGATLEFPFAANISNGIPRGNTPITITATVNSDQSDNNYEDNTDFITITASNITGRSSGSANFSNFRPGQLGGMTKKSELVVSKTADTAITEASSSVPYTIEVKNDGDLAYQSVLVDQLKDSDGNVISEGTWNLGKILPNEEIKITYDVVFSSDTLSGTYTNYAQVYALEGYDSLEYGRKISSNVASFSIEVESPEKVLGLATCAPLLTSYMGYGKYNDQNDVEKLQNFLRDFENYEIEITGEFDYETDWAVRLFQERYGEEILEPWGDLKPSGYVYYTTQKKINNLYCSGLNQFSLSLAQQSEILFYKAELAIMSSSRRTAQNSSSPSDFDILGHDLRSPEVKEAKKSEETKMSFLRKILSNIISALFQSVGK